METIFLAESHSDKRVSLKLLVTVQINLNLGIENVAKWKELMVRVLIMVRKMDLS